MYKSEVYGKGGIYAKVVADSIANGVRLTTMEVRFHRFILPEFNTHRMFSRNFSSSRAIPIVKMIEQVKNDPAMPIHWGKNQAGMQAREECSEEVYCDIIDEHSSYGYPLSREDGWKLAAKYATGVVSSFNEAGYHKQIVNRLLEPFQFVKGVVTATEWHNFFKLRDHEAAQPEIQELARCMKQAMDQSNPYHLRDNLRGGEWHLPYVDIQGSPGGAYYVNYDGHEMELYDAIKCSVARCARVSYMKHDNTNPSIEDDIDLYNALATRPYTMKNGMYLPEDDPIHASPAEHQATPMTYESLCLSLAGPNEWDDGTSHMGTSGSLWSGNFKSWVQYRKLVEGGRSV